MHTKKRATVKEKTMLANRTRMDIDQITRWILSYKQNRARLRRRQNKEEKSKKFAKTTKGHCFLPIQTAILKEFFEKKSYPDMKDIEDIKILINEHSISNKIVKRWFASERCLIKKLKK